MTCPVLITSFERQNLAAIRLGLLDALLQTIDSVAGDRVFILTVGGKSDAPIANGLGVRRIEGDRPIVIGHGSLKIAIGLKGPTRRNPRGISRILPSPARLGPVQREPGNPGRNG